MNISIIVPVYNALELARQCVASIFEHGSQMSFEVIVVDNGSAKDVGFWLKAEAATHSNLRYVRSEEPLGFAGAANRGAANANGEALIVLNSDTVVTPLWMDELFRALLEDPSLGALTPMTNHAGETAQMDFATIDLSVERALTSRSNKPRPRNIFYLPQRVTFFCVAIRRSVWLRLKGLDEAYAIGNFEDDDFCLRLRMAGFRLGVAEHIFVYHHNNATFEANGISHTESMRKNVQTFVQRAFSFSNAPIDDESSLDMHPIRRSIPDISIVIFPAEGQSLDRTLRSLANQTIVDFEILPPGSTQAPRGLWIAYLTQGDVLFPFHLETLFDALERTGSEAVFADSWLEDAERPQVHPDAASSVFDAPLFLPGWMHHASLNCNCLREQSIPLHWPRLTWTTKQAPILRIPPPPPPPTRIESLVEAARRLYRRLVPFETRLSLNRRIRGLLGQTPSNKHLSLTQRTHQQLEGLLDAHNDRGRYAVDTRLPTVFFFNAVTWHSARQRQHHFAWGLAVRGHSVFWIDTSLSPNRNWWTGKPFPEVHPGIYLVRLPSGARDIYGMAWEDETIEAMTSALLQTASAYGLRSVILLVNYPRWQPLAARLNKRCGWPIVSDSLDDQRALADLYQTELGQYEERLLEGVSLLFTSSVVLQERLQPRQSTLLPNANDFELFSSAKPAIQPETMSRPIVGFFGALADWLDMDLIHAAALRFPHWSFLYIGPHTFSRSAIELKWLRCTDLPNIVTLPQMNPSQLARQLATFDVCIIPFLDLPVTRTMNPVKFYEYCAAGKPTVSRDLPEVRHLAEGPAHGLIELYRSQEQFFIKLQEAISHNTPELAEKRRSFAAANDWNHRCDVLSQMLVTLGQQTSSSSASSNGEKTRSQE